MQHVGVMDERQASECLEQKILDVLFGERLLRVDDSMQVRLHELHGEVKVCVFRWCWRWFKDRKDADNIFMLAKVSQELKFSQRALCYGLNFKRVLNLLDRHLKHH